MGTAVWRGLRDCDLHLPPATTKVAFCKQCEEASAVRRPVSLSEIFVIKVFDSPFSPEGHTFSLRDTQARLYRAPSRAEHSRSCPRDW
jgi:hypothetical protein